MKKLLILIAGGVLALVLFSCGEAAPVKEIEDAKTAIERARSVEAPFYAEEPFKEAESEFQNANDFLSKKKNKEAKEKAIVSKEKATLAYHLSITNGAVSLFNSCGNLMDEVDRYFGFNVDSEAYEDCSQRFQLMKMDMDDNKFENVYWAGKELKPKLEDLLQKSKAAYEDASSYVSGVERKYNDLSYDRVAKEKAKDMLAEAKAKIDEAKGLLANGEYEQAKNKAKEAEELCDKIGEIVAQEKGKPAVKGAKEKANLEKEMNEAMEAIKKAKEKQQELQKRKKIIFVKPELKNFVFEVTIERGYIAEEVKVEEVSNTEETNEKKAISQADEITETVTSESSSAEDKTVNVNSEESKVVVSSNEATEEQLGDENVEISGEENAVSDTELSEQEAVGETEEITITEISEEEKAKIKVKEEDISEEMVNKYISIAEELYDKGEYSKSLLYANEAIRMADILLEREYTKYYRVRRGDCLWNIAKFFYKRPLLWPIIYKANKGKIKHPDLIYPNQVFAIPPAPKDVDIKKLYREINYKPLFRSR